MIPKIIHYCWFGGAEKSPLIKKCIETWRKVMPDYELKEWNETNFDFNSVPFVHEAYEAKKWAFVADYVRLYAMYHFGGVYMDTDVKVMRPFDEFLKYSFFTCQESHPDIMPEGAVLPDGTRNPDIKYVKGIGLCSAVMGAEKACPYLKDCLDYYNTIHFDVERKEDFVIVNIIAVMLEKYGYRYILDRDQILDGNMAILKPHIFAGMSTLTGESYALHLYNGSWVGNGPNLKHILRNKFPSAYSFLQDCFYKIRPPKQQRPITKRLLIVSTHLSHPTDAGNRAAIMAQVNSFKNFGYEVHFLFGNTALRHNMNAQEMKDFWGNCYHEYKMPWIFRVYRYLIDKFRIKFCNGYWKVDDHYPTGISRFVNKLDDHYKFDVIMVQYIRLSKILPNVKIPKKGIFTHDVFAYKDIRTGAPFYETCTAHEEAKALQRCPNIFAIQEQEATYYKYVAPLANVYTVYNPFSYHPQPVVKSHNVLFLASPMQFNIDAMKTFVSDVWPNVVARIPDAKLLIAGGICTVLPKLDSDNIVTLGHVESLDEFYAKGNIVINPVNNGTGLKIKTFEGLSYGKTTIVHPHSLIGIYDKEHAPLYLASTTNEWVKALTDALSESHDLELDKQRDKEYIEQMNQYILSQYKQFLS